MLKKNQININKNVSSSANNGSNFQKINSIMNQRLVGLLDYLAASVYFSRYNENKSNDKKNLEKFFKSKVFIKKPFVIKSHNNLKSRNKKPNKYLNIQINIKNNKLNFNKSKFTSPYVLHEKKSNFLKNMVDFSKYIHSEEKKENNIKIKYPKLESISVNSLINSKIEDNNYLKLQISRVNSGISTDEFNYSRYPIKSKSLYDLNINNLSRMNIINNNNKIKSSRTTSYLNYEKNKKNRDILQWKKKLKIKNFYDKDFDGDYNSNNVDEKYKTQRILKPNCYYNKLHLSKISKKLTKFSFKNKD